MPALDANADVTAPTAQISSAVTSGIADGREALPHRRHGAVALQRGDVGHDAADEQHDAPGDALFGASLVAGKASCSTAPAANATKPIGRLEDERGDGDAGERHDRADLIDAPTRFRRLLQVRRRRQSAPRRRRPPKATKMIAAEHDVVGEVAEEQRRHRHLEAAARDRLSARSRRGRSAARSCRPRRRARPSGRSSGGRSRTARPAASRAARAAPRRPTRARRPSPAAPRRRTPSTEASARRPPTSRADPATTCATVPFVRRHGEEVGHAGQQHEQIDREPAVHLARRLADDEVADEERRQERRARRG